MFKPHFLVLSFELEDCQTHIKNERVVIGCEIELRYKKKIEIYLINLIVSLKYLKINPV